MNVNVNDTSNRFYKLYLYAGPASAPKSPPKINSATATPAPVASNGTNVRISDAAKAASAALGDANAPPAASVKDKIDVLYAEVRSRGSSVTFDISKPGELLDVSSLTDNELGKIAVDKGGDFPQELRDYAAGALNARLKVSLEPYENAVSSGDRRAHVMTIKLLYEQMSPDTRAALHWTPTMIVAADKMLEGDTKLFGPFSMDRVHSNLLNAVQRGGLSFSPSTVDQTV